MCHKGQDVRLNESLISFNTIEQKKLSLLVDFVEDYLTDVLSDGIVKMQPFYVNGPSGSSCVVRSVQFIAMGSPRWPMTSAVPTRCLIIKLIADLYPCRL